MDTMHGEAARAVLRERRDQRRAQIGLLDDEQRAMGAFQGIEQGTLSNHLGDDGSLVFEAERLATVDDDLRDVLHQVEAALQRLDDGIYDRCPRCGGRIAPARLAALPYVATGIASANA